MDSQPKTTWEDVLQTKAGTILDDWYDEGVRCVIMRGPASLCAYVGVPATHPLAGFDYDNVPINCHGGVTFSGQTEGEKGFLPADFYWYGWDYAHAGDYCTYYDEIRLQGFDHSNETKWMLDAVKADMWDAVYSFRKLIKLTEAVAQKLDREVSANV